MAGLTLRGYLDENPLDPGELRLGKALRIVRGFRSAEGRFEDEPASFVWQVLVLGRAAPPKRPLCLGVKGQKQAPTGFSRHAGTLLSQSRADWLEEGATWHVDEYSFTLPLPPERVIFLMGGRRVAFTREQQLEGVAAYGRRIENASVAPEYPNWLAGERKRLLERHVPVPGPLMSIVLPAYKTPPRLLREALASVVAQTYGHWELVVVNASPNDVALCAVLDEFAADSRVRVVPVEENRGIVGNTNLGIRFCQGDYVSFFDHDDVLEPCALAELVRAIEDSGGEAGLLYCDEDNIDEEGNPSLPLFKPSSNPDLLLNDNYVLHWLTIKRNLLAQVEPSGPEVEGAQDYDLTLKIMETGAQVVRVPHVLYHWRLHEGSTAADPTYKSYTQEAGMHAVEGHIRRQGWNATVSRGRAYFTYDMTYSLTREPPRLVVLMDGALGNTTRTTLDDYARLQGREVEVSDAFTVDEIRRLAQDAPGANLLVLGAKVELDPSAIRALVALMARTDVFSVSPEVVRTDGLIEYAGTLVLPDGQLGRLLHHLPLADGGYVGRSERPYDALVANPECSLFRLDELGRLLSDNDFATFEYALAAACARAAGKGLHNVYLPAARARLSRPRSFFEREPDSARREDARSFVGRFCPGGDPSHNPNFDPWSLYYKLGNGENTA